MLRFDFKITRPYLGLTLPVAVGTQMDNLVGFAEIFLVRSLGENAISAVGISRQIVWVVAILMVTVATGTMAMVAQAVGARNLEEASQTAKQSLTLVTLLSGAIGLFGFFTSEMALASLSVPEEIAALGAPYLRVFFLTVPMMGIQRTIDTCLYASGDSRTPLIIAIVSIIVRIFVAYGLIFGTWGLPEMCVTGAAAGGLAGGVVGNVTGLWALYSGRFGLVLLPDTSFVPERARTTRILRIGIPAALQGLFRNGSNLAYLKLVALTAHPAVALAAFTIANQMERFLRRSSLAFGTAATSIVGQSLGAGDLEEAERRGWTSLVISVAGLAAIGVPIVIFARQFMEIFTDGPEVIAVGVVYLYAMALAEPLMTTAITSEASLRAAGNTIPALYYTLIAQWLVRIPLAWVLAFTMGLDVYGIWYALVIFSGVQGVLTLRKFAKGEWKTRKL